MKLEDNLLTLFTATIDEHDGTGIIQLPDREIDLGTLSTGETFQVALLQEPGSAGTTTASSPSQSGQQQSTSAEPPVSVGDQLDVEIEDVGEKGDGVTRVGPGYIVFVPGASLGDRVTIEITEVRDNYGFADVVTPEPVSG